MVIKDAYGDIFKDVKKILVVLAHPDDLEISCGGLIARLTKDDKAIRAVITTNGGKGTKEKTGVTEKEFSTLRVEEQFKAGEILGISRKNNFNLQIPDGELETTIVNIGRIVFHIREFQPDLVITHNPLDFVIHFFNKSTWINHRDHRNTGIIALDAVYPYSRDTGFFPEHFSKYQLKTHSVKKVLINDSYNSPFVKYFDISEQIDQKKKALQQHLTAFNPADAGDYIDENKFDSGYFEPLAYYEVY